MLGEDFSAATFCFIFYYITNFYFTYLQRLRADSIEENLNSTAFIFLKDCLEVIIR